MDNKSTIVQLKEQLINHPSHLWIGVQLEQTVIEMLKKIFCKLQECNLCSDCKNISQKTHKNVIWINPEKGYVLEHLEPLIQTSAFKLEHNEHLFFILQKGETLTHACANKLLKFLEEPPQGYHSIIISTNLDSILPTIQSRSLIKRWHLEDNGQSSPLFEALVKRNISASAFLALLEKEEPTEHAAFHFAEKLFVHTTISYQDAIKQNDLTTIRIMEKKLYILKQLLQSPPQTGSSKLFLKNLFLQLS